MKVSFPCYPGIPGPWKILKGARVGESTVIEIIFHQPLGKKLEIRLNERKQEHT